MAYSISDISIIIPNWNGQHLLEQHLPKVREQFKGAEIIISDDHSNDDSVSFVKHHFEEIIVVESDTHDGFSSTVNRGVKKSSRPLVFLLNSDIEPEDGCLMHVLPHFLDETVFAVGLMDKSIEHSEIHLRGRGVATFSRGMYIHSRGEVDAPDTAWVSGGSGVFRKSIWNTLGGLDELFNPFYWEDIDISYRAKKAGYTLIFEPKATVIHKHEEGAIQTHSTQRIVKQTAFRNQLLFIWKNITDQQLLTQHVIFLPYHCVNTLLHGDSTFIIGLFHAISVLPQLLKKRRTLLPMWKRSDTALLFN